MTPTEPQQRGIRRGRPRTTGPLHCDRCRQPTKKIVARWPEGAICYPCYSTATRTHGTCPNCTHTRMLPGRDDDNRPICVDCADITLDLHCERCNHEGERYRSGICARCALRDDLRTVLRPNPDAPARKALLEALSAAARPHSVITWMRGAEASALLAAIGNGSVDLSHAGLDSAPGGKHVEHLRRAPRNPAGARISHSAVRTLARGKAESP